MEVRNLSLSEIVPSPRNPRKTFDKESLKELADNIKQQGLLQPITVRPMDEMDGDDIITLYEIVCGERRWRACKLAGMTEIPSIVKEMSDEDAFFAMITENLQRQDVDPMEEAAAIHELQVHGLNAKDIAAKLGRSERFVQDRSRLVGLIEPLQKLVKDGLISIRAAILLVKLDAEMQQEFFDDNYDADDDDKDSMTYEEVKDWIDSTFGYLRTAFFLDEEGNEDWLDGKDFPKCKTCVCNTANQGCLFYEMKGDAKCTNTDCLNKKKNAYVWHYLHTHDFLKKGEAWQTGKMLLEGPKQPSQWWSDAEKERYKELVKKIEDEGYQIETNIYSKTRGRCYYALDDERRIEAVKKGEAVETLALTAFEKLSRDCFYLNTEEQKNDVTKLVNRIKDIESSRTELITMLDAELKDFEPSEHLLEPFVKAIVGMELMNKVVSNDLHRALMGCDRWQTKSIDYLSVISEHPNLMESIIADVVKLAVNRFGDADVRKYVLDSIKPGSAEAIYDKFEASKQKKIDEIVEKLKELGYDKDGNRMKNEE